MTENIQIYFQIILEYKSYQQRFLQLWDWPLHKKGDGQTGELMWEMDEKMILICHQNPLLSCEKTEPPYMKARDFGKELILCCSSKNIVECEEKNRKTILVLHRAQKLRNRWRWGNFVQN